MTFAHSSPETLLAGRRHGVRIDNHLLSERRGKFWKGITSAQQTGEFPDTLLNLESSAYEIGAP